MAKKNSKTLILVVYLFLAVSCLVWLAAYTFYFRQESGAAAREAENLRNDLTRVLPPEDPAAGKPPEVVRPQPSGSPAGTASPDASAARQGLRPARARAETSAQRKPPSAEAIPPRKGKIAVILDDAGYENVLLGSFLNIPAKLTVSVLPGLPGSGEAARMIRRARKEMMLHLPMEPTHGEDPGPEAVFVSLDDEAMRGLIQKHIDSLPGIAGVNNHMGSRATEDERVMRNIFGLLKERGLYFIDSRTTARSAGPALAREFGLRCRERSVFLDNEQDADVIRTYFDTGKAIAAKQGWAIMIGHVWCAELARLLPALAAAARVEGYEFVFISELFAEAGT